MSYDYDIHFVWLNDICVRVDQIDAWTPSPSDGSVVHLRSGISLHSTMGPIEVADEIAKLP